MLRTVLLVVVLAWATGCSKTPPPVPAASSDAAIAAHDRLIDEFSGVWRGASSGSLLYLVREGKRLHLYIPDGKVPVTMGSIDVEQSTVNLTLPGGRGELVWTLSQVTDNHQGSYHLMITVDDGRQQEFSFVREVSEEDMRRLRNLAEAEVAPGVLAAVVTGDDWVAPTVDDEQDPPFETAASTATIDASDSEASDSEASESDDVAAGVAPDHAPSFDCAKDLNPAETLVCDYRDVAELDRRLSTAYRLALSRSDQPEAERSTQMRWLVEKRNACDDAACLRRAYRQRLKYFEGPPHHAYSEHAE